MKREAVRFKQEIIMDGVREKMCSEMQVEYSVVPMLIRLVGKASHIYP